MSPLEVKGRDAALEAYRVKSEDGYALVPECLMINALRPGTRPSHQDAYEWIAANRKPLSQAIAGLVRGKPAPKPFDIVTLIDKPAFSFSKFAGVRDGQVPDAPDHDRT